MTTEKYRVRAKRAAIAALLVVVAAVSIAGCGSPAETTRVVRVGHLANDMHQLAYYVARENGYFKEEGLDVREAGAFNAGPEEMSAFSARQLDIGYVGTAPALTFAGQDMAEVKAVAGVNRVGSAIVIRNGLEGGDISALKGRNVAVPGYSTMQDFLLRIALGKARVDARDLTIMTLKPPEMAQALSSAQIDAFIAWEPYPTMTVTQGGGRVLEQSSKIWPHHPCCLVVVDSSFLLKNPDTVQRFVRAHEKATEFIKDNPEEAADLAARFTGQDREIARKAMTTIEYDTSMDKAAIQRYAAYLKEMGVIKVSDPASFAADFVEPGMLQGGGR